MAEYVTPDFDVTTFTPSTYAEGTIPEDLAQIETAIYGRDVRASIVESLYLIWVNQSDLNTDFAEVETEFTELEEKFEELYSFTGGETDYGTIDITDAVITISDAVGKKNSEVTGAEIFNDYENNSATGEYSTAMGYHSTAGEKYSFATGCGATASGLASVAIGFSNEASAYSATAFGYNTEAAGQYSFVIGKCNTADTDNKYAFIIGNGTSTDASSNALTVDWDGNLSIAGDITVNGETSVAELQSTITALQETIETLQSTITALQETIETLQNSVAYAAVITTASAGDSVTVTGYGNGDIKVTGTGEATTALTSSFANTMSSHITTENQSVVTIADGVTALCDSFGEVIPVSFFATAIDYLPWWVIASSVASLGSASIGTNNVTYGGTMARWKTITGDAVTAFNSTIVSQLTITVYCIDGALVWNAESSEWEEQ